MLCGYFKQVFCFQVSTACSNSAYQRWLYTCSSTLINKFPSTVASKQCLFVIRGRGSRGTLRLRCPSGLRKAGGMADRRGATIYSSVQLRISAKVVGAASLLKHPSKYKTCPFAPLLLSRCQSRCLLWLLTYVFCAISGCVLKLSLITEKTKGGIAV